MNEGGDLSAVGSRCVRDCPPQRWPWGAPPTTVRGIVPTDEPIGDLIERVAAESNAALAMVDPDAAQPTVMTVALLRARLLD